MCFNSDLSTIKTLNVGTITIYQPNYYILTAAQSSGIKVVLGLYDDSVSGLAASNSAINCTYGGAPYPYCGTAYANALFNGTCGNLTPWPPATFCESSSNNPNATYVAALNSSAGQFLLNGTVVGIQLGNEILGQVSAATLSTAAQNLRTALNAAGFSNIKIIVSLIEGQAAQFCSNGVPPTGVDYIADRLLLGWFFGRRGQYATRLADGEQPGANLLDAGAVGVRHRPDVMRSSQCLPG